MKSESRNTFLRKWIELPCKPCDLLDWRSQLAVAEEANIPIVWKIDAGLEQPFYPLEDELRFQAISLALRQFSTDVWPRFQQQTSGICLYKGSADFQTEAYALYFQMLSHKLPDEAEVELLLDLSCLRHPSDALKIISHERFDHFQIAIHGMELPLEGMRWDGSCLQLVVNQGLVFPETVNEGLAGAFDLFLQTRSDVKIVFERHLSSQWEGMDRLFVIRESLGPRGQRMLQGFCAAGGEVTYI